ncbi:MAG: LOG family protein, partial [Ignavibacteriae bacterium]|nr:LOG family protein [Ignavibacteriota bacterium]
MIGKLLAQNNFNVCSGGFQGIMDAVSKGAKEYGSEAIGITVDLFNAK